MKKVYICSPCRGDYENNIQRAKEYSRAAVEKGVIPVTPHIYLTQFMDDNVPEERELALKIGSELVLGCSELWAFGIDHPSAGMAAEIELAKAHGIPVRTGFRGREVALIELRSLCIPNEGTAYLLDLLSRMTNENSVSTNDNGVTQTVEARQGVALNAVVEIKPRVMLRPFRTFLEVEQPESEFLLRVDPDEGIGFFEADGGIWKLEAKKNIADYFLKNMGDLIDAGKVVVMQ